MSHSKHPHEKPLDPEFRRALRAELSGENAGPDGPIPVEAWFGRVRHAMANERRSEERPSATPVRHRHSRNPAPTGVLPRSLGTRWAAALVVVLGIVALFGTQGRWWRHRFSHSRAAMEVYTTANGQRANISLLDGTTVTLGVASRLEVPADYGSGNYTVRLSGQALFTVHQHHGVPFTVQAGTATARVLGTTFAVDHYPTDTTTKVAVRDGKVMLNTAVLTASRLGEVGRNGPVTIRSIDASPFLFATGVLAIERMPLSNAIPMLNRWYDVDIRLGNPALGARLIKGRFPAGSPSDLTEVLGWMFDARVVRQGRVLTLFSKGES